MTPRRLPALLGSLFLALAAPSCLSGPATSADPFAPVPGSPEGGTTEALARLDRLAGRWASEATAVRPGTEESFSTSSTVEATHALGERYLEVRTTTAAAGPEAQPSTSLAIFTWDPSTELYRTWTYRSTGELAMGSMSYDPETEAWTMTEVWYDPESGARGSGGGIMRHVGPDERTFDWEMRGPGERVLWRVEGTSRRIAEDADVGADESR